jgi:hypothetical protein
VSENTEQAIGFILAGVMVAVGGLALYIKNSIYDWYSWPEETRRRIDSIAAAVLAYLCYVSADFLAGSEFPRFLRDHLFDGLVPAALVGILIGRFPRDNPLEAFPRIERPINILVWLFAGGALVFGVIAAAAVFSSEGTDYGDAIYFCASYGGGLFVVAYVTLVSEHLRARQKWWFTKRSEEAT